MRKFPQAIYLDNAATTPVNPKVSRAMQPYLAGEYGNPSEYHFLGRGAREAIEKSRQRIAKVLGSAPGNQIIFTGSATEAINLAHKGLIEALRGQFKRLPEIIVSKIEHKAILETCLHLEKLGWVKIKYLSVDSTGLISLKDLQRAITPQTVLVSVMYVNNEVGTIEPIVEIGKLLKKENLKRKNHIFFHTDATQAMGHLECKVTDLGVDLLSFSGHKIGAPKGVGALWIKGKTPLIRQLDGGGQELNLRSGTENVPYIVGLGKAVELLEKQRKNQQIAILRDRLIKGVGRVPGVKLTGSRGHRAPHIASFVVDKVEGEGMVLRLSDLGIMASSGSACTANNLAPSHVLLAMGIPVEETHGSIRFSLGPQNTLKEIEYAIKVFPKVVYNLRAMAPDF